MGRIRNSKKGSVDLGILLLIAVIIMAGANLLGFVEDKASEEDKWGRTESQEQDYEPGEYYSDDYEYEDEMDDITDDYSYSEDAPVPYPDIEDEDLIGYWTNDKYDDQPTVVQMYMAGGVLEYRMFAVMLGDGSGIGLENGHSIFEYNDGMVDYDENRGALCCHVSYDPESYIEFICENADKGELTERDYGETWYRWDDFPYEDLVYEHYGY